jgi:glutaredoxin
MLGGGMSAPLRLFVKPGCPWCTLAEDWLDAHGYGYERIDVLSDRAAFEEMIQLSGQRRAPTLEVAGRVLPDFGPEELALFLERHSIAPPR